MLLSILCKSANCTGPDGDVISPNELEIRLGSITFPALANKQRGKINEYYEHE